MKTFYLILALAILTPSALLAQQQGWGNEAAKDANAPAKDDLDQIDEPEEGDAPVTPPPTAEPPKRAPVNNPQPLNPTPQQTTPLQDNNDEETEEEAPPKWVAAKLVKLQGLNKVTAKTSEIDTKIGDKVKFGNLEIQVDKCMREPDSEKPDNTALMTIWDGIPGQDKKQVFHGWMFSSSPALSGLENPIYDVILLSCADK